MVSSNLTDSNRVNIPVAKLQFCVIIHTMPKSKKPKKAYRPKYQAGQLPMTIRHTDKSDLLLQMIPHDELEKLRRGEADEYTINTLAFRLNWGYVMAGEVFDNPEVRQAMEMGLQAIRYVKERFARLGKYGANGAEFAALGEALNLTDEMQKTATRREQHDALKAVYLINQHKQEN